MEPVLFLQLLICLLTFQGIAASTMAQDYSAQFRKAGKLFGEKKYEKALQLIRELDQSMDLDEELEQDVRWAYISALTTLAKAARHQEDWVLARKYSKESVEILENSSEQFLGPFLAQLNERKFWSYKNLILACHGLDELKEAQVYRDKMYEGYRKKVLPKGIDKYFNIDFFRQDGKNVWGYEYYPQLGDPESKGSFTKFVYHIYSAKEDRTDKEQLYLLHVVRFHKVAKSDKGDYVLTKRWMVDGEKASQTLYDFIYDDPVDMKKLRSDVRQFLRDNPDSPNPSAREKKSDDKE